MCRRSWHNHYCGRLVLQRAHSSQSHEVWRGRVQQVPRRHAAVFDSLCRCRIYVRNTSRRFLNRVSSLNCCMCRVPLSFPVCIHSFGPSRAQLQKAGSLFSRPAHAAGRVQARQYPRVVWCGRRQGIVILPGRLAAPRLPVFGHLLECKLQYEEARPHLVYQSPARRLHAAAVGNRLGVCHVFAQTHASVRLPVVAGASLGFALFNMFFLVSIQSDWMHHLCTQCVTLSFLTVRSIAQIAPHAIDVNVHPTKREVQFLHEEEIVSGVRTALETLLLGANSSRVFQTQQLVLPFGGMAASSSSSSSSSDSSLSETGSTSHVASDANAELLGDGSNESEPRSKIGRLSDSTLKRQPTIAPSFASQSSSSSALSGSKPKYQPNKLVRTDALNPQGRLDSFLRKTPSDPKSASAASSASSSSSSSALDSSSAQPATDESAFRGFIRKRPSRPPVTLTSVHSLIDDVERASHEALTLIFQQHSFVGCIDDTYCLVQHKTKLYVINVCLLSQSFFYEQVHWSPIDSCTKFDLPLFWTQNWCPI